MAKYLNMNFLDWLQQPQTSLKHPIKVSYDLNNIILGRFNAHNKTPQGNNELVKSCFLSSSFLLVCGREKNIGLRWTRTIRSEDDFFQTLWKLPYDSGVCILGVSHLALTYANEKHCFSLHI